MEFLDAYFYHTPGDYKGVKRNGVFVNHLGPYSRREADPGYNVSSSDLRKIGAIPDGVTLGTFLFRHLAAEIKARTRGTNGKTWAELGWLTPPTEIVLENAWSSGVAPGVIESAHVPVMIRDQRLNWTSPKHMQISAQRDAAHTKYTGQYGSMLGPYARWGFGGTGHEHDTRQAYAAASKALESSSFRGGNSAERERLKQNVLRARKEWYYNGPYHRPKRVAGDRIILSTTVENFLAHCEDGATRATFAGGGKVL